MNLNDNNICEVSVIMPVHNSAPYLVSAINSCLNQSFRYLELIVVNDNSTDDCELIVKRLMVHDKRIKLLTLSINSGAAVARNIAINVAKGRYIAFLDSDDYWAPDKLSRQLDFMGRVNAPFSFTRYSFIDENNKFLGVAEPVFKTLSYRQLLFSNFIACSTVIYDSHILGKNYMPDIRKRQDYGLWLNLLKKTTYAYGLNEVLAAYRVSSSSISSNKLTLIKYNWQLFRRHEKLPFWQSVFYLFSNIYFRFLKFYNQKFNFAKSE